MSEEKEKEMEIFTDFSQEHIEEVSKKRYKSSKYNKKKNTLWNDLLCYIIWLAIIGILFLLMIPRGSGG